MKLVPVEEWMADGVCRTVDPELWFAEVGDYPSTQRAKALCNTCPVIERCLQFALDNREPYGVWGGLTALERRQVRRRGWRELAS